MLILMEPEVFKSIHDARHSEFRRVLRQCAIAVGTGANSAVLYVPAAEAPQAFVVSLHEYARRRAARPVLHIGLDPEAPPTAWITALREKLGLGERPVLNDDEPLWRLPQARFSLFEELRTCIRDAMATEGRDHAPGMLLLGGDASQWPTLQHFLRYLAPPRTNWMRDLLEAKGVQRSDGYMVVAVVPDDGHGEVLEGPEPVRVRPVTREELAQVADVVFQAFKAMGSGRWHPAPGKGHAGRSPKLPEAAELMRHGCFAEAALVATEPKDRLTALVGAGRLGDAFSEACERLEILPPATLLELAVTLARDGQSENATRLLELVGGAAEAEDWHMDWAWAEVLLARGLIADASRFAGRAARVRQGDVQVLNTLAKVLLRQGRLDQAEEALHRAQAEACRPWEVAMVVHNLGLVALYRDKYVRALSLLHEAMVAADEALDVAGAARARYNAAVVCEFMGHYSQAYEYLTEAMDRLVRLGDRLLLPNALLTMADLLTTFGDPERALALVEEARGIVGSDGRRVILAVMREAQARLAMGESLHACRLFERAVRGFEALGADDDARWARLGACEAYLQAGRLFAAARRARPLAKEGRRDEVVARSLYVMGRIWLRLKKLHQAKVSLERARNILLELDQSLLLASIDQALSEANRCLGRDHIAAELWAEAVELAKTAEQAIPAAFRASFASNGRAAHLLRRKDDMQEQPGADLARLETGTSGPVRALSLARRSEIPQIVGDSQALRKVLSAVERVANTSLPVLLYGESGTGKELLAEAIHRLSPRNRGPFVRVNAAAFTESLLLSELFGHERGAFTGAHARKVGRFEAAHGGTLFLDEIGDISPSLQVALLRVLEDQAIQRVGSTETIHVDVRVVFATNKDLGEEVRRGRFREDLYHRVTGFVVVVPPLRERKEDIVPLAEAFLKEVSVQRGRLIKLASDAARVLRGYSWPGNVRELKNVLNRVALLMEGEVLDTATLERFAPEVAKGSNVCTASPGLDPFDLVFGRGLPLAEVRKRIEAALIYQALQKTGGNIAAAARLLGMKRPRLSQLVKEYGLKVNSKARAEGGRR